MFFILTQVLVLTSHITATLCLAPLRFGKRKLFFIWGCYCILFGALGAMNIFFHSTPNKMALTFAVTCILHIVLYFYTTTGRFLERLFLMLSYIACFCISMGIIETFLMLLNGPTPWIQFVVSALVFSGMLYLLLKKMLPIFKEAAPSINKSWWLLCLTVLLYILLFIAQTVWPLTLKMMDTPQLIFYFVSNVLFCFTYLIIFTNIRNTAQLNKEKISHIHLELLQTQIDAQQSQTEEARRARHDIRHHNNLIAAYAKTGDVNSILSYLEQNDEQLDAQGEKRYCENDTLNTILSVYAQKAGNLKIAVSISVGLIEKVNISPPDMVAIVANIMENAIHGSQLSTGLPYINVRIVPRSGKLVIRCENSCKKELCFEDTVPENIKGIGINSVIKASENYGGQCSFSAKDGIFTAIIILDM